MPHVACRRIARGCEPAARAPLRPAPVLDGTPVGTGALHTSILVFPTDIVLGAVRRIIVFEMNAVVQGGRGQG